MYKRAISILLCLTLLISILLPMDALANDSQASEESGGNTGRTDDNSGGGGDGKRELVDERDAYSKTFVDDQGRLTKEIYAEPIHYKKSGKWQTISDDLVNDSGSEALETDTTQLQAKFPKRMKDKFQKNQGITYGSGDNALSITSLKAVNDTGTLWPNTSSKVENKKNQILYQNIFPSMDLRHISFNKEVKEDWILHKYEGIHQFEYEINTKLIPHLNDNGSIGFYKDSQLQHKVFEMPKPVMEDSNYNTGLGSGVKSTQLHYTLTKVGDQSYQVRLDADKDWLTSPDRVYPIYIDPSVTIDILGDTFISSAYPTTNYNKEWDSSQGEYVLKVGKYDSTTGTNYAFMKFEIVGDLKGSVIDSADLKAYVTHSYYASQKTGIWIDRVTSAPWYVNELTWNNRPSSTNITSTSVARDQWADFNVKSAVQGMVDGDYPNYGFKIHENGNGQTYWKKITAAESTNKAKLVISYHYPTMKNPTVSATQYGKGDTTGYVNVSWPSVTGASSYDLQMFDGKGFETVYSGTATSWTSKSKKKKYFPNLLIPAVRHIK
ncbi:DNRLRE domain-containing protein [Terrilactibacillus sp. S3-3]|nr:DNRLRE domain-containing protein [Terrilactibacillus sp. S3-3]